MTPSLQALLAGAIDYAGMFPPASLDLERSALQWKDWTASVEQIAAARRRSLASFGSCSFDEPRDDLKSLGWL